MPFLLPNQQHQSTEGKKTGSRIRTVETDRIGMSAVLVLGAVRRIAEGLAAAGILAHVRLFSRVRAQVSLEILQPRVRLAAALKLHTRDRSRNNSQSTITTTPPV